MERSFHGALSVFLGRSCMNFRCQTMQVIAEQSAEKVLILQALYSDDSKYVI